jgi:predicted nucleic acid-binding protein
MIVVSDTSALTSLLQINRADILQRLYKTILIPPAVESDLRVAHPLLPSFIQTAHLQNQNEL